ncbi:hypothetical protein NGM99_21170 [Mesorhizobium sp. RP14(2022)]|uniref:Uncharacterized protein n=1 Tax=Mesorhizobium liriopis TaxID=2953882 RepID=A0ABT1CBW2_9HYPH|nr:hypothetical protein [Mesorhizobium liriopis]MCO6052304.1 hypothetical protein [Mesorhizobium liriopis]
MAARTTRRIARFDEPFWLSGLGERMPAGKYHVEHEWEIVEGGAQSGYRRSGLFIHVPSIGTPSNRTQLVPITAIELQASVDASDTNSGDPSQTENQPTVAGRSAVLDATGPSVETQRAIDNDTSGMRRRAQITKDRNELI